MKNLKEKGICGKAVSVKLSCGGRYPVMLCLVEISGSSIGFWSVLLDGTYESSAQDNSGDLLGTSRASERMNGR